MIENAQTVSTAPAGRLALSDLLLLGLTAILAGLHGYAIWVALGGAQGLNNGWPLWRDDHPLYYHSALVTRSFLRQSWTTAGYDPAFMSGYAKSVVFPASSTLPELVIALFGGRRPELAYKLYVLASAAAIPWLIALAAALWRIKAGGILAAVTLFLIYVWTDFPINYAGFGMLPYLLAIPLGLTATAAFVRYIETGGALRWLIAASLMILVVLVHFTSAMIVAPTAAVVYATAVLVNRNGPAGFALRKHLAVWSIPLLVLGLNAFWWLPGIGLAATKGSSDFAFHHPEGVLLRGFGRSPQPKLPSNDSYGCWPRWGSLRWCVAAGQSRWRSRRSWRRGFSGDTWRAARGRLISCNRVGIPMPSTRGCRSWPVWRWRTGSTGCGRGSGFGSILSGRSGSWWWEPGCSGRAWSARSERGSAGRSRFFRAGRRRGCCGSSTG